MKLDIGCGDKCKEGFIGVDLNYGIRCDFNTDPLPFEPESVDEVYSSHCLEHLSPNSVNIYKEITRVCQDGAKVELWFPYAWNNTACVIGHNMLISESIFQHMASIYQEEWKTSFGKYWNADKLVYEIVSGLTFPDYSFAIKHYVNVVYELGVFCTINKDKRQGEFKKYYSFARDGEQHEINR